VAFVKRLVPRHDIARQVAKVHWAFADKGLFRRDFWKIGCSCDCADSRQSQCLLCIDPDDPSVSMRAALDLAEEHARHRPVGSKISASRDLLDAIRTNRSSADNL
jgi:hypothetical protein